VTLNRPGQHHRALADGVYSARRPCTTDGLPLAGRSAEAFFLVGVPVTASVSGRDGLPPGTTPVTTTISVTNQSSLNLLPGGKIVVAHDEWTSATRLQLAPASASAVRPQPRQLLTGGQPGSFLVYSDNFT
jgi:hypothetical protein